MVSLKRAATAIAAILVREGVDYAQSKAVFKAARERAGLRAPTERRAGVMLQTLLETGVRASELVQLRIEDISLSERVVTIRRGKGAKRREVPIRRELTQLLRLHISGRRAGPLFPSRERGAGPIQHVMTRQRVGQIVREVASAAGITKPSIRTCCGTRWRRGCLRAAWTSPICSASWVTKVSPRLVTMPKPPLRRSSAASMHSPIPVRMNS